MTDREYEKMMVESLYDTRRELINRFNLNKGGTNA
ncbi:hypothetical protein [Salmonella phage GSP003]|nr:hypothetical protein [Salmonella phage GSP003]